MRKRVEKYLIKIMTDVLKLGKKIFTVGVVATTIFWSVGVAALVPAVANAAADCPTLSAGDMVKVSGKPAIYALNNSLQVLYFPSGDEFKSWTIDNKYSGYKTVSQACFDSLAVPSTYPGGVNYRPGTYVLKRASSDQLYVVEPNNTLAKITTEAAKALYGSTFKAVTIADAFWPHYVNRGSDITEAKAHEGMLVKNNNKTYYVDAGNTLREVSAEGMTANRFQTKYVHTVADSVISGYSTGSAITAAVSAIVDRVQGGGASGATLPGTTGGALSISLAADTPAAGYAVASAARVSFTKVVFTAGANEVKIDSFKVKRTGYPAVNADFSTINVVTPEGNLLNDSGKTLNSDNEVTFTEDIVIPAGSSKTYTLVGNMAAANAMAPGNVPKLALTEVNSNASSVSGLPVEGNAMTTNKSLTLSTVLLAEGSQIGTVTKQVGSTNVNLANVKITNSGSADTKNVKIEKVVLYNAGTAADADVTNLKLKYNSNTIVSGVLKDKYVTFDLSSCTTDCTIEKGYDKTYEVYGDLTAGSGRTVNLDVQYATHVSVKDVTNNVYITPTDNATTMTNTVIVSQGKLNVTKTDTVQSGNIAGNASNLALGSWNFKVTGEPIDVRTIVFKITTTGTVVPTGIDSLVLYDANGKALIGSTDGVGSVSPGYATSTDTFTLQPGDNILTVKGKVDNTAVANDTVKISIEMSNTSNFVARGVNSQLDITLGTYATPQSVVDGNLQTVQTSGLTVTTLSQPAARTYAAGTSNVLFSKVMFDASGSSEDVKISRVVVTDNTGAAGKTIDIQSVRLKVDKDGDSYDGSGSPEFLSETVSGSDSDAGDNEDFTFNLSGSDQFVVKKGKKVVMEVYGNIAGGAATGANATHVLSVNTTDYVTATGVNTGNTVTETISSAAANAVTVGASGGQVAVSLSSDNPSASLMAAGTEVTLATFNFLATTTEDVEIDYLYLTQVTTDTNSSSYKDYDEVWFVNEAGTEIAGTRMAPTSTMPKIDFSDKAFIVPVSDTDGVNLHLKAKLATIGVGSNGTADHYLGYKIATTARDVVAKGAQTGSATTEFAGSTAPTGNTHYVYNGYPKFEKMDVSTNKLANGTRDLYKFKVTAVNGDIALYKFTFDVSTTVATVTNLYVYDVTESNNEKELNATAGTAPLGIWESSSWDGTGATGNQVTVSKVLPRIFVLRGNVASAGTGASVTVSVAGDAGHVAGTDTLMHTAAEVDNDTHDDFIWSDKSASGHTSSTDDWTNGYLVFGLSSTSSSAETVSY